MVSTIWNTRLFTGREYDQEIGLYYNRARYYSAQLGRFISRDPIDIQDDINLYAYVGNNPVMYVDLFGREKQLLRDIENGNRFVVELASRNLDDSWGFFWIHTWIIIHSIWDNGYKKEYTIWGHENPKTWKLDGVFNDSEKDFMISDRYFGAGAYKWSIYIDTPDWFTDAQFVRNIYDEYKTYNANRKEYAALSMNTEKSKSWNCNNFSTTLLYNASNYDSWIVSSISNFDPRWGNPWLWEAFWWGTYKTIKKQDVCSE